MTFQKLLTLYYMVVEKMGFSLSTLKYILLNNLKKTLKCNLLNLS
jgi:hypothetical protein